MYEYHSCAVFNTPETIASTSKEASAVALSRDPFFLGLVAVLVCKILRFGYLACIQEIVCEIRFLQASFGGSTSMLFPDRKSVSNSS